jgi:hypothetical protein
VVKYEVCCVYCRPTTSSSRKNKQTPDGDDAEEDAFARLYQDSLRRRRELEQLRERAEATRRRQEETFFKCQIHPMSEQLVREKGSRAPARQIFDELYSAAVKRQQMIDAKIHEAQLREQREALADRPSSVNPGSTVIDELHLVLLSPSFFTMLYYVMRRLHFECESRC